MKKNIILLCLFLLITIIRLIIIIFFSEDKYYELYQDKTNQLVYIKDKARGSILDCNGNVLVYDEKTKAITFTDDNYTLKDKIDIVKKIANIITIDTKPSLKLLKDYYLVLNTSTNLITNEEYQLYEERKITKEDIYNLKIKRIDNHLLKKINPEEAVIYNILSKGFSYEKKIIKKKNVTKEEFALINESNIKGVTAEYIYERKYNYADTLKSILGSVGSIPYEKKDFYLAKGYYLNDKVGLSYLEEYYEEYLTSTPSVYKVVKNKLVLVKEGEKGNDVVLNIDIDLQQKMDNILKEQMIKTKKEKNTDYYDHSYIVISNPNGEIKAVSSKKLINNTFVDNANNFYKSSYTMGSVVKIGSHTVNYYYDLIPQKQKITDSCVKLFSVPAKCSFQRLGRIDDISALAYSSNYYQFIAAIKSLNKNYKFNMKLNVTDDDFNKYRNIYAKYGLGVKTGIDLLNEEKGLKGNIIADDLFLNLTIGQYDNYTVAGITQYINTIANDGNRISLSLMKEIQKDKQIILKNNYQILNEGILEENDYKRIKEGMKNVFVYGTGRGVIKKEYQTYGKTGTSESIKDGVLTTTKTLALAFQHKNEDLTLTVISPNVSFKTDNYYVSGVNNKIAREVLKIFFEN